MRTIRFVSVVNICVFVFLMFAASSSFTAGAVFCGFHGSCETCLNATLSGTCDWIPSRVSCVPRNGEDEFLAGVERVRDDCTNHTTPQAYPPWNYKHECYHGGMYSVDPAKPFGAMCDCPHGLIGSKCQVCNSKTICPVPGEICKQNIRGVPPGEHRELSCDCTSDFCSTIGFGPGHGVVNVRMNFGKGSEDTFARIDILKRVDNPVDSGNSVLKSPFVIKANLTHCSPGEDIPCAQVCGIGKCPAGVPWTEDETCRVWDCDSDAANMDLEDYTDCPPSNEPWSSYSSDCGMVRAMMRPPFQFICIVPKNPGSPLVNGKVKCGFATQLLSHGSIALDCSVGNCVNSNNPSSPSTAPTPHNNGSSTPSSIFVCSGRYGDQECWNTYYFLILMVPVVYTLSLVFSVVVKEREVKGSVHAARVLRAQLLLADEERLPPMTPSHRSTTTTSAMMQEESAVTETDQFIQQQQQQQQPRLHHRSGGGGGGMVAARCSPILSFNNVTFGIQDTKASTNGFRRDVDSIRNRRRGIRTVLHPCSGHVKSGEICAILGPSGSGKTSLIDILAGRKNVGFIGGGVYLDGRQATSSILREKVGYVTQDDVLPSTSTVRECLLFHAALRGNCTMPLLSRCERVEDVLEELCLQPCADSMIGSADYKSISGGEKRRVSIACELLGENNSLLVMDEPTSGLDSNSTQQVISALLAVVEKEKRTIILSIHQPSSALFNKFNRVILLSATGRMLFCGPRASLEVFFNPFPLGCNPAEHLLDLCAGSDADEMHRQTAERFEQSGVRQEQIGELRALVDETNATREDLRLALRPSHHTPSFRKQFVELSARSLRNAWRHPVLATTNVIATLAVGVSCGLLYRGVTNDLQGAINRAGLFFFFLCFLMLASVADLGVFHEERLMLMRERASGAYSSTAYLASKVLAEILPLRAVPLSLTAFILTYTVGLNPHPHAVFFFDLLLLSISIVATLQFLCLGMLFPKPGVATFGAILLTMFSLLMSGFLLQFDGTGGGEGARSTPHPQTSGFEWLQSFSVLHYGFEALMVNELHGLDFQVVVKAPDGTEITRVAASGDLILAQLGFVHDRFNHDVGMVLLYWFAFSILSLVALKWIVVERR